MANYKDNAYYEQLAEQDAMRQQAYDESAQQVQAEYRYNYDKSINTDEAQKAREGTLQRESDGSLIDDSDAMLTTKKWANKGLNTLDGLAESVGLNVDYRFKAEKDGKRYSMDNKEFNTGKTLLDLRYEYEQAKEDPTASHLVYTLRKFDGFDENHNEKYLYKNGVAKVSAYQRYKDQAIKGGYEIVAEKRFAGAKDWEKEWNANDDVLNNRVFDFGSSKQDKATGIGFGCVHPDTKVWTEAGLQRIADLTSAIRVLSWNEKSQKFQLSLSGGSFPKGKANLYRVLTLHGEFVSTERHHVFSSESTYQSVGGLSVGQSVMLHNSLYSSTAASFEKILLTLDVQNFSETVLSYLESYADEARQYGLQLLSHPNSDQAFSPSQVDALECTYEKNFVTDGQVDKLHEHTHLGLSSDHMCMQSYSFHALHPALSVVDRTLQQRAYSTKVSHSSILLPQKQSYYRCKKQLPCSVVGSSSSSKNPLIVSNIISVSEVEVNGTYYDMQVLGTNNYVDEYGFIHHNSGKTELLNTDMLGVDGGMSEEMAAKNYEMSKKKTAEYYKKRAKGDANMWSAFLSGGVSTIVDTGDFILDTLTTGDNTLLNYSKDEIDKFVGYDRTEATSAITESVASWKRGDYFNAVTDNLITKGQFATESLPMMVAMSIGAGEISLVKQSKTLLEANKKLQAARNEYNAVSSIADVAKAESKIQKITAIKNEQLAIMKQGKFADKADMIDKWTDVPIKYRAMNHILDKLGYYATVGTMTNNVIDDRIANGDTNVTMLETMAIAASQYLFLATDKLSFDKIVSSKQIGTSLRNAFGIADREGKQKFLSKIGSKAESIAVAVGAEGVQEYTQTWGEILGANVGVNANGVMDVLGNSKLQDEALGGGLAGAAAGGHMHVAADVFGGSIRTIGDVLKSKKDIDNNVDGKAVSKDGKVVRFGTTEDMLDDNTPTTEQAVANTIYHTFDPNADFHIDNNEDYVTEDVIKVGRAGIALAVNQRTDGGKATAEAINKATSIAFTKIAKKLVQQMSVEKDPKKKATMEENIYQIASDKSININLEEALQSDAFAKAAKVQEEVVRGSHVIDEGDLNSAVDDIIEGNASKKEEKPNDGKISLVGKLDSVIADVQSNYDALKAATNTDSEILKSTIDLLTMYNTDESIDMSAKSMELVNKEVAMVGHVFQEGNIALPSIRQYEVGLTSAIQDNESDSYTSLKQFNRFVKSRKKKDYTNGSSRYLDSIYSENKKLLDIAEDTVNSLDPATYPNQIKSLYASIKTLQELQGDAKDSTSKEIVKRTSTDTVPTNTTTEQTSSEVTVRTPTDPVTTSTPFDNVVDTVATESTESSSNNVTAPVQTRVPSDGTTDTSVPNIQTEPIVTSTQDKQTGIWKAKPVEELTPQEIRTELQGLRDSINTKGKTALSGRDKQILGYVSAKLEGSLKEAESDISKIEEYKTGRESDLGNSKMKAVKAVYRRLHKKIASIVKVLKKLKKRTRTINETINTLEGFISRGEFSGKSGKVLDTALRLQSTTNANDTVKVLREADRRKGRQAYIPKKVYTETTGSNTSTDKSSSSTPTLPKPKSNNGSISNSEDTVISNEPPSPIVDGKSTDIAPIEKGSDELQAVTQFVSESLALISNKANDIDGDFREEVKGKIRKLISTAEEAIASDLEKIDRTEKAVQRKNGKIKWLEGVKKKFENRLTKLDKKIASKLEYLNTVEKNIKNPEGARALTSSHHMTSKDWVNVKNKTLIALHNLQSQRKTTKSEMAKALDANKVSLRKRMVRAVLNRINKLKFAIANLVKKVKASRYEVSRMQDLIQAIDENATPSEELVKEMQVIMYNMTKGRIKSTGNKLLNTLSENVPHADEFMTEADSKMSKMGGFITNFTNKFVRAEIASRINEGIYKESITEALGVLHTAIKSIPLAHWTTKSDNITTLTTDGRVVSKFNVDAVEMFSNVSDTAPDGSVTVTYSKDMEETIKVGVVAMIASFSSIRSNILNTDTQELSKQTGLSGTKLEEYRQMIAGGFIPEAILTKEVKDVISDMVGIRFKKNADKSANETLQNSLVAHVLQQLKAMGNTLEVNSTGNPVTKFNGQNYIKLNKNSVANQFGDVHALEKAYREFSYLSENNKRPAPTPEPVKASTKVMNSTLELSAEKKALLKKNNSTAYRFHKNTKQMSDIYRSGDKGRMAVLKLFGYKDITSNMSISDKHKYTAVNDKITRETEIMFSHLDSFTTDSGEVLDFYLKHGITKSTRMTVQSDLTYQDSKIHREFISTKAYESELGKNGKVDINKIDVRRLTNEEVFEIALSQAFDLDPDKNGKHQVFTDIREIVDIYGNSVTIHKVAEKNGAGKTISNDKYKWLRDFIEADDIDLSLISDKAFSIGGMHTVKAVITLRELHQHGKSGSTEPFISTLTVEADAITSGVILQMLQVGSRHAMDIAAKGGVYTKEAKEKWSAYTKNLLAKKHGVSESDIEFSSASLIEAGAYHASLKHGALVIGKYTFTEPFYDIYTTVGKTVFTARVNDKNRVESPALSLLSDAVGNLNLKTLRNISKSPVMIFNYGALIGNILESLAREVVTPVFINNHDFRVEVFSNIAGGDIKKRDVLYSKFMSDINNFSILDDNEMFRTPTQEELDTMTVREKELSMVVREDDSNPVSAELLAISNNYIGKYYSQAFDEIFGELTQLRTGTKTTDVIVASMFKASYESRVAEARANNNGKLSGEDFTNILKELEDEGLSHTIDVNGQKQPLYKFDKSKLMDGESETGVKVSVKVGNNKTGTIISPQALVFTDNSGAAATIPTHNTDANVIAEAIAEDDFSSIYDAIIFGANHEDITNGAGRYQHKTVEVSQNRGVFSSYFDKMVSMLSKVDNAEGILTSMLNPIIEQVELKSKNFEMKSGTLHHWTSANPTGTRVVTNMQHGSIEHDANYNVVNIEQYSLGKKSNKKFLLRTVTATKNSDGTYHVKVVDKRNTNSKPNSKGVSMTSDMTLIDNAVLDFSKGEPNTVIEDMLLNRTKFGSHAPVALNDEVLKPVVGVSNTHATALKPLDNGFAFLKINFNNILDTLTDAREVHKQRKNLFKEGTSLYVNHLGLTGTLPQKVPLRNNKDVKTDTQEFERTMENVKTVVGDKVAAYFINKYENVNVPEIKEYINRLRGGSRQFGIELSKDTQNSDNAAVIDIMNDIRTLGSQVSTSDKKNNRPIPNGSEDTNHDSNGNDDNVPNDNAHNDGSSTAGSILTSLGSDMITSDVGIAKSIDTLVSNSDVGKIFTADAIASNPTTAFARWITESANIPSFTAVPFNTSSIVINNTEVAVPSQKAYIVTKNGLEALYVKDYNDLLDVTDGMVNKNFKADESKVASMSDPSMYGREMATETYVLPANAFTYSDSKRSVKWFEFLIQSLAHDNIEVSLTGNNVIVKQNIGIGSQSDVLSVISDNLKYFKKLSIHPDYSDRVSGKYSWGADTIKNVLSNRTKEPVGSNPKDSSKEFNSMLNEFLNDEEIRC